MKSRQTMPVKVEPETGNVEGGGGTLGKRDVKGLSDGVNHCGTVFASLQTCLNARRKRRVGEGGHASA